ncbi:hypothetical protein FPV67DRAFT_1012203 [Lyophyllum atratum]|nr:hypothetical protein FPV67DRAFT_1012203 [Lyophyllum atratum]
MESPSILPNPRLRLSRNANAYEFPVAGPSRDRLTDNLNAVDLTSEDSDNNDQDYDEQPTPKMTSTAPLMEPTETPAARLRALLARTPASSKSTPMPQRPSNSPSDNESDFDPPSGVPRSSPSMASESLKDIFSRALRDPGNTPQKGNTGPRRNSIDTSEVEAIPRIQRERAKNKLNRKSLSDEEIENISKSPQRSEASFRSSRAATFDTLREQLMNPQSQLKDMHFSDALYEDDDTNDHAPFLQDINLHPTTPPAATSTPQQSLRMSGSSQYPFQSNLMEQDSEMQRAIEDFDSYDADGTSQRPVSFPPLPCTSSTESQSHQKSYSEEGPHESIITRKKGEELLSASRTSSANSFSAGARQSDDPDRLHEREREWNKPKTPARAQTPELHRQSSHQRFPMSESPIVGTDALKTLSRQGSNASLRSFDESSSRGSSFGSQAESQIVKGLLNWKRSVMSSESVNGINPIRRHLAHPRVLASTHRVGRNALAREV